jgi:predicted ATP-dependent Lon-type protease
VDRFHAEATNVTIRRASSVVRRVVRCGLVRLLRPAAMSDTATIQTLSDAALEARVQRRIRAVRSSAAEVSHTAVVMAIAP